MEISVKRGHAHEQKTACLVVGVHAGKRLGATAEALDKATRGLVSRLVKRGDLGGAPNETLLLPEAPGTAAERILLVGCGRPEALKPADYLSLVQKAARTIAEAGLKNAVSCLAEIPVRDRDAGWKIRQTCLAFGASAYRFERMKSKPSKRPHFARLGVLVGLDDSTEAQHAVNTAKGMLAGLSLMKDLANLPGNHCPPAQLAETARELGKTYRSLKVTVLERADMHKLGMGALLAVAQGSAQPPKLITLEYRGCPDESRPIVLVGKGVTFDSGGISIKPGANMDEMKFDMTGAASVLGVMKAVAELALPINVVGVVPTVENMPDGHAIKPGDVVTSLSGQTIEILNTDAEGRLILCDALSYAARFEPDVVIDIATLTGACVVALGSHASGLLSNHDALADELLAAGEKSGDRAWRLPLWDDYQKQLDSPFADMANVGGREAGTITAACFLSRYTKDYRWAHLDIAGTAWTSGKAKGSTGRPLPLLMEFILGRANLA
ncbi:MAG TPA: leucyl aminopeptidase [Gammaproteobacteria bacterium]|nr:leucyl aminopeptidase [Gammaproteobacteria bacterium]